MEQKLCFGLGPGCAWDKSKRDSSHVGDMVKRRVEGACRGRDSWCALRNEEEKPTIAYPRPGKRSWGSENLGYWDLKDVIGEGSADVAEFIGTSFLLSGRERRLGGRGIGRSWEMDEGG